LPNKGSLKNYKNRQARKVSFIQLEPNIKQKTDGKSPIANSQWPIVAAAHPLFTKYTFVLDLTKTEEELLKNMHQKARYNIRVAQKHDVEVVEDDSSKALKNTCD